jgi:hypothetical protein
VAALRYRVSGLRAILLFLAIGACLTSAADTRDPAPGTRFLSPQNGSQAVGVWPLEVATTVTGIDRVDFFIDGTLAGVARKPPYRVMHDFGASLAPHEIEAKVFSNGYRTVDAAKVLTAGAGANESVNVDLVEVPLRAHAPQTLTARDLTLRENGVEQTIRDVLPQRGAARFVFVVDRSLSMGEGKLAAALHAIDGVWQYLRPDDRVEAVLFNHNAGKPQEVPRGAALSQIVGEVEPSGGTSLRDAVSSIASRERTYAIVLTDGGDRNSAIDEEAALERISGTKTVLDAIVFGGRSDFLERAAKNTGGDVVRATPATTAEKLRALLLDINSRYLVVYQSHGNGPGWRSIAITPVTRGVRIVTARKGYFAR